MRTSRALILLSTVLIMGVAAAPAAADSVWTQKQDLSASEHDGRFPQVAIAEDGTAIAVWMFDDPVTGKERVQFAMRKRGENFAVPAKQPNETQQQFIDRVEKTYLSNSANPVAGHIRIAMNHAGDAVVTWQATDGTIRSAYKPHDGDFGSEQLVTNGPAAEPEVGIDGQGNATVIWAGTGTRSDSIYKSQTRPAGAASTWGGTTELISHPLGFGTPEQPVTYHEVKGSLAVDEAGNSAAVLSSDDDPTDCDANNTNNCDDTQRVFEVVRAAGASDWTLLREDTSGANPPDATLALRNGTTRHIFAWSWFAELDAVSAHDSVAGARDNFSYPEGPSPGAGWDFVAEGSGLGMWADQSAADAQADAGLSGLHDSYIQDTPQDDPQQEPNPIAGNSNVIRDRPKLASDGNGTVVSVFREVRDGVQSVQVALRPPPAGDTKFDGSMTVLEPGGQERSGAPVALSEPCDRKDIHAICDLEADNPPTDPLAGPNVAMNSHGEGVAVWAQEDGSTNQVVKTSLLVPRTPTEPGGPPPIPLPPPPPPRPKPAIESLIVLARPLTRGAATVLSLKTGDSSAATSSSLRDDTNSNSSEDADQLNWHFGTPDEPPVEGDIQDGQLERSVRLRLPNRSFQASVQAQTPDGIKTFTRSFTVPSPPDTPEYNQLTGELDRIKTPPVFSVGKTAVLTGASSACSQMKVWTGEQKMSGCMKPIEGLPDIPGLERGAVHELADQLNVDGTKKELMDKATGLTDGYVADGKALLNDEFPVIPDGASHLVDMPQAKALMAGKAELPIGSASFDPKNGFNLKVDPKKIKIPLGPLPNPPKLPSLGGLEIVGDWDVDLEKREATVHASLKLPKEISKAGINGFANRIDLRATPDKVIVDHAEVGPIDAGIGPLGVRGFKITYDRAADEWDGQASSCITPELCIDMVPPKGGIKIKGGKITFAGATVDFPLPGIPLFKGIYLTKIGFGIGFDPTRMVGSGTINAVELIDFDGKLILAFPSSRTPFVLKRDEVGDDFNPGMYGQTFSRTTIALTGGVSIKVPEPLHDVPLAHGYMLYEFPGYIAAGGRVDIDLLDLVQFHGAIEGAFDIPHKVFNVHGDISMCLLEQKFTCGGAVANISHGPGGIGGAGGCINIGPISIGGGVQWNRLTEPFVWPFDGCKWSRFAIDVTPSRAAAADHYTMHVRKGQPSPALKLYGQGNAPMVRVSGPSGSLSSTSDKGLDYSPGGKIRILRFRGTRYAGPFTVVGLQNADPGDYSVDRLPGPAITGSAHATDLPDAAVKGRVTGEGRIRVLHWNVRGRPGQRVYFQEVEPGGNAKIIATTTKGGRGHKRFSSAPGRGRREVVAQFELSGMPAERKVVTRFKPQSPVIGRPRRITVFHTPRGLRVRWSRVKGATRYQVAVRLRARGAVFASTRRRSVLLRHVPRWGAGLVTVRAIDDIRQGRPTGSRRFPAIGLQPSGFRPLLRCRYGKTRIKCTLPKSSCVPRRLVVSGTRIGSARIGRSPLRLLRRYLPLAHVHGVTGFCVQGGGAFWVGARNGRIDLISTSGSGHRTRAVGPGRRLRRGRLPGTRPLAPGLLVGHRVGGGRVIYGVSGNRVRFLAVVSLRELKHPGAVRRRLRALGYR